MVHIIKININNFNFLGFYYYIYQSSILDLFDAKAHLDRNKLVDELLPLWDIMRMQQGYEGQTFKTLQEAQDFVLLP